MEERYRKLFYSAERNISRKKPRWLNSGNKEHQNFLKLAKEARWLLSQNHLSFQTGNLRNRYYNLLLKNKLAYYNGRIKNNKLFKAFQNYYSSSFLKLLGCSIESNHRSWIFRLFDKSKSNVIHHPVRHLLMMNFLGISAREFLTSFIEYEPFVEAPYPCLNRASVHFGELRIQTCEIFDNQAK